MFKNYDGRAIVSAFMFAQENGLTEAMEAIAHDAEAALSPENANKLILEIAKAIASEPGNIGNLVAFRWAIDGLEYGDMDSQMVTDAWLELEGKKGRVAEIAERELFWIIQALDDDGWKEFDDDIPFA